MSSLYTRVFKRIKMTAESFRSDCHFSVYYACLRVADELGGRLHLRSLSQKAYEKKSQWIMRYLEKDLEPVLRQYRDSDDHGEFQPDAPIWVCWWTGEESAPPLVKQCIRSIRENAGAHPLHLITRENYANYITIPDYILQLVERKRMKPAHLSDYIRVSLLAEYGGLWLDATIFCTQTLPDAYFAAPLFTCKSLPAPSRFVSDYRWTTFCLGGYKEHLLYRCLKDAFERYWSRHEYAIDYLFFDYLILLAYIALPVVKEDLEAVSINNLHRDDLQAAMNAALPAEQFDAVIKPDTLLYKLSWRESYKSISADGRQAVYGLFVQPEENIA